MPDPTPTPTPIHLSAPVIGPSGQAAYVEGEKLFLVEPDGSRSMATEGDLGHGSHPLSWSPDGQRLVYATERHAAQWEYHVWESEIGQRWHLNDAAGFPSTGDGWSHPIWSPDGQRLLLWTWGLDQSGVWVADVETRSFQRIAAGEGIVAATWVSTATILYQEHHGAWYTLSGVDTPASPTLLTGTLGAVSESCLYTLSTDRRYLAGIALSGAAGPRLEIAPLPGHPPLNLPAQPTDTLPIGDLPLWSPDGRWVAYGARRQEQGEEVYTVLVDTTALSSTRVIAGLLPHSWSPDSRLLVGPTCSGYDCNLVVTSVYSTAGQVRVIAPGEEIQLWDAAWAPGGGYLAYSASGPDADLSGVVLWDRVTGERHLLVPGSQGVRFTDLEWTPDDCRLYLVERNQSADGATPSSGPVNTIWSVGPDWAHYSQVAPGGSDEAGPLPCPDSPLTGRRLIAYYGTPLGPGLGILGRFDITTTLALLAEQIQAYRELDQAAGRGVENVPGFHMVVTVADNHAGSDGDYNHRVAHAVIRPWIEGVKAAGGWAVLDVQPGHADLKTELDVIEPLLWELDVHLAMDPEFMMTGEQVPGSHLGQISGQQINQVQARLDRIGRALGQHKLLIIHQFEDSMVVRKEDILPYPFVDLVWDSDGFGGPGPKIGDYNQYRSEPGFEYGGFKLFYEYDTPLMTPEQVLALDPPAAVVIYQ